jgi:hypothetical protein
MVGRRTYLAQMEAQYAVCREHSKGKDGNRNYGKKGREIRHEIKFIAGDQKLDVDTMKLLRRVQRMGQAQAQALNDIAGLANNTIIAAGLAFRNLSQ